MDFENTRINEQIRITEVRLIDASGRQVGIVPTFEAKRQARESGLDLVEINPKTRPPICKIMDFGKFKFDTTKKMKEEKAKQTQTKTKEIKFHPNVSTHDYSYRLEHIKEFLAEGNKVKASVVFHGREIHYIDRGRAVLDQLKTDLTGLAIVENEHREEKTLIVLFRGVKV